MFKKVMSLRITSEDVADWLNSQKRTGRSINTIINDALLEKMKADMRQKVVK